MRNRGKRTRRLGPEPQLTRRCRPCGPVLSLPEPDREERSADGGDDLPVPVVARCRAVARPTSDDDQVFDVAAIRSSPDWVIWLATTTTMFTGMVDGGSELLPGSDVHVGRR